MKIFLQNVKMTSFVFDNLAPELKTHILSQLEKPEDINNLLYTSVANFSLSKPVSLIYSTNSKKFTEAYKDALIYASKNHSSLIATKGIPDLEELLEKYKNIHEYNNPVDDVKKLKLYNKGIIIYLQILNERQTRPYLYGLAQLISYKSGLVDIIGIDCVRKYRIVEFELYKLYVFSYLLEKNTSAYICDALQMINDYCENGISPYIEKANPSQKLCYLFLECYFSNTNQIANCPVIDILDNTMYQCITFMIKDGRSLTSYTRDVDLIFY